MPGVQVQPQDLSERQQVATPIGRHDSVQSESFWHMWPLFGFVGTAASGGGAPGLPASAIGGTGTAASGLEGLVGRPASGWLGAAASLVAPGIAASAIALLPASEGVTFVPPE